MILVISNYRTGSSTLLQKLSKETGLTYWDKCTGEWCHGGYRPPVSEIGIYKIMADILRDIDIKTFEKHYIEKADKIYYTVRKDIRSQINSAIYSFNTNWWHPHDKPEIFPVQKMTNIDHYKHRVLDCLFKQRHLYKMFGGEIVYLEDRMDKGKYQKPKLEIPDYDLQITDGEEFFSQASNP